MSNNSTYVGVLSLHNSKETKAILNAVEALGHTPRWLRAENTVVRFEDDMASLVPDLDIIVNRLLLSNTDQPFEELGLAQTLNGLRPMLNVPEATARAAHKTAAASRLINDGLPIPKTLLALSNQQLNAVREEFGEEAVYKTAIGTHGGGAWKVNLSDPLTAKVGKRRAFLQELVGRQGESPRDLRVYVVDNQVVGAMYRYATESDWRTNVARGGSVEDATDSVPSEVLDIARQATTIIGHGSCENEHRSSARRRYRCRAHPYRLSRSLGEPTTGQDPTGGRSCRWYRWQPAYGCRKR